MRRDPKEMGVYALPRPVALGERREAAAREPFVDDPSVSDGDLIRRVARRDANAFEALYRRYSRSVFGLALRRLGDRMSAEDAVQETFAAIWRSARTYKPDRGAGAPWLYAVARNAIVDRSRGRPEPPAPHPARGTASAAPARAGPDPRGGGPDPPPAEPSPAERAETSYTAWRV